MLIRGEVSDFVLELVGLLILPCGASHSITDSELDLRPIELLQNPGMEFFTVRRSC